MASSLRFASSGFFCSEVAPSDVRVLTAEAWGVANGVIPLTGPNGDDSSQVHGCALRDTETADRHPDLLLIGGGGGRLRQQMEWDDDWLAPDKLQHVLACLLISLLAAALAARSARPALRRRAVAVGSAASLAAGAAKEAADEAGFLGSAGASPKDAAADLVGVAAAALVLVLLRRVRWRRRERKAREDEAREGLSMV